MREEKPLRRSKWKRWAASFLAAALVAQPFSAYADVGQAGSQITEAAGQVKSVQQTKRSARNADAATPSDAALDIKKVVGDTIVSLTSEDLFPAETKAVVTKTPVTDDLKYYAATELGSTGDDLLLFDISLKDGNGDKIELDGREVLVTFSGKTVDAMEKKADEARILYVSTASDAIEISVEEDNVPIENGEISFTATHFSVYGIDPIVNTEGINLYVSPEGDDVTGDGTEEKPYATLAKAGSAAPSGSTIYVMDDLTMKECMRYFNKELTITSIDPEHPVTVTRGEGFAPQNDPARSWYNPALIEVGGTGDALHNRGAALRLENIILDDAGRHEGTLFEWNAGRKEGNLKRVQDSMIASYNGTATIYMGEGAVLRNYGGMSGILITDESKIVMESGSLIEDTEEITHSRGSGALWLAGGELVMEEGSVIQNLVNSARGIYATSGNIEMNGEITGLKASGNAINLNNSTCVLGAAGNVHDNTCATAVIYLRDGSNLTIKGKINDNHGNENLTAVFVVTNGGSSHAVLEEGGEICRNKGGWTNKYGGAVDLQQGNCTFTMNGGIISGNSGFLTGGVQVRKNSARFIMNGGEIRGNSGYIDGVFLYSGEVSAQLNGGTIDEVGIAEKDFGAATKQQAHIDWKGTEIENPIKYMTTKKILGKEIPSLDFTVWTEEKQDIMFGNPSASAKTLLKQFADSMEFTEPKQIVWCADDEAVTKFMMSVPSAYKNSDKPVYVIAVPTDETGAPVTKNGEPFGACGIYTALMASDQKSLEVSFPTPRENGYALGIVQPDMIYGEMTITGPDEIVKVKGKTSYEIPYEVRFKLDLEALEKSKVPVQDCDFCLNLLLDKRLSSMTLEELTSKYTFESKLFTVESITKSEGTLQLICRIKDDIDEEKFEEALGSEHVLKLTALLDGDDFEVGKRLYTSGNFVISQEHQVFSLFPDPNQYYNFVIMGNVWDTLMVDRDGVTVTYLWAGDAPADAEYPCEDGKDMVSAGDAYDALVPEKVPGYTFDGWYTDEACLYRYMNGTELSESITLYGRWRKNGVGPRLITETLPGGEVDQAYSEVLEATGDPVLKFTLLDGALPDGLDLLEDGTIRGILSKAGTFTFTAQVWNSVGTDEKEYTIVIGGKDTPPAPQMEKPVIKTERLPGGKENTAYEQKMEATGDGIIYFTLTDGTLPDGLVLLENGNLRGVPSKAGTFTFSVTARNEAGASEAKTYTVVIAADETQENPPVDPSPEQTPPSITTDKLSSGTAGYAYNQKIEAAGDAPITFSISNGALPDGLKLASDGTISGTTWKTGTFTFTVKAENKAGSAEKSFTIVMNRRSSSGGNSSSGSGSSGSSSGSRTGKTYTAGIDGSWVLINGANHIWNFKLNDGTILKTQWAYVKNPYAIGDQPKEGWFYFFDDGVMAYGWYKDAQGRWYYLHGTSDGMLGTMVTGWHHDTEDGKWYYLNPADGVMVLGWQKIDGKSYYFNPYAPEQTWDYVDGKWTFNGTVSRPYGSMYQNEQTPDGYSVDANGVWIP